MTPDFEKLRDKYLRLMPSGSIKWLLIAESPPSQRSETPYFFYYDGDDVNELGGLFETTMMALYKDLWNQTVAAGGSYPSIKRSLLTRFSSDGFYLIDETDQILSGLSLTEKRQALVGVRDGGLLLGQLEDLAKKGFLTANSRIVLVSALGYDLFFGYLRGKSIQGRSGSIELKELVVNKRIPLPYRGREAIYIEAIRSLCAGTVTKTKVPNNRGDSESQTGTMPVGSRKSIATKPPIDRIVVDGSNVACYEMGHEKADLSQLTLAYRQLRTKYGFNTIRIIVGAGLRHKAGLESFEELQRVFEKEKEKRGSRILFQAPARTNDDTHIITYAIENDCLILTDDLYRDYLSAHPHHSKEVERRLVKYMIMDGSLIITGYPPY